MTDPETIITVEIWGQSYAFQDGQWSALDGDLLQSLPLLQASTPTPMRHDTAREFVVSVLKDLGFGPEAIVKAEYSDAEIDAGDVLGVA